MASIPNIKTIFTAVDKFSPVVKRMAKSIAKFSKFAGAHIKRFDQKITRSFKKLGRLAQVGLGLGVGALFREGFTAITDFETGLVGVGKTTGIVGPQLKELGFDVLALSKSMRGITATKLLEFAQVAGQMGISSSTDILKFSETMAKLEKSTDIVGEEGATSISRLLTIVGEGVGDIDKFGSALVALGNTSAATESEILSVASEVARATTNYRLSSHEILGISTALKSLDVAPEAAGSAVLKVFTTLEMATLKGGKNLRELGKIMDMTPKQIKDAFGKSPQKVFTKFIEGLGDIEKEGGSATLALSKLGLSGTRVAKGIIPLAINSEILAEKIALSSKAYAENTALQEEFDVATQTVNTGLIDIRKSFNNILTTSAATGSKLEFLQKILFYISDNMRTIILVAGSLLAAFVALKVIVAIINGISWAIRAWAWATKALTVAQWLFNAALWANPVGVVIGLIVALVAIVALAVQKYDEWGASLLMMLGPLGWIINLIQSFRRNWDMIKNAFKSEGIIGGLKAIGKTILDALLMPMEQFLTMMAKIPGMGKLFQPALDFVRSSRVSLGMLESPEVASNTVTTENIKQNNVTVTVADKGGNVESVDGDGGDGFGIFITPTVGVN